MRKNKLAFTLAEVLIVLGILAIIAEVTIPTLIQKGNDRANATMLKKQVSTLQSAITQAITDEGPLESWCSTSVSNTTGWDQAISDSYLQLVKDANATFGDTISRYLKVNKNCRTDTGCLPPSGYRALRLSTVYNYDNDSYYKMQLADGTILILTSSSWSSGTMAGWSGGVSGITFYIDVNGLKGPNKAGEDLFIVAVNSAAQPLFVTNVPRAGVIIPQGAVTGSVTNACYRTGLSCATWAYYNGNLDYKYCTDLNWETKTSCY